jgi:hypothetical protein
VFLEQDQSIVIAFFIPIINKTGRVITDPGDTWLKKKISREKKRYGGSEFNRVFGLINVRVHHLFTSYFFVWFWNAMS